MKPIGELIKAARMAAEVTQAQLADMCGIKRVTISKYERGEIDPPFSRVVCIVDKLKVDVVSLACGFSQKKLKAYEETGLSPQEIMDAIRVTLADEDEMLSITDGDWSVTAPAWYLRKVTHDWIDPKTSRIEWGEPWMGIGDGDRLNNEDGEEVGVFFIDGERKTVKVEMYKEEEA